MLGRTQRWIDISVDGETLKQVKNFVYFEGKICSDGTLEEMQALSYLLGSKDIGSDTNIIMYETLVSSSILGCCCSLCQLFITGEQCCNCLSV